MQITLRLQTIIKNRKVNRAITVDTANEESLAEVLIATVRLAEQAGIHIPAELCTAVDNYQRGIKNGNFE